jgi:hypothetical protein
VATASAPSTSCTTPSGRWGTTEILDGVWQAHGRRYDKKLDGPLIAGAMDEPPTELADLINSLAGI